MMVDSVGPQCTDIALSDLADVANFGDRGKEGVIYAFQFQGGVYVRKKVTTGRGDKAVNFRDLEDVEINTDVPVDARLSLVRSGAGKWSLVKTNDPDWGIDLAITTHGVQTATGGVVRKVINNGSDFVSYTPDGDELYVKWSSGIGAYTIGCKDAIMKSQLNINSEFPVGILSKNTTIILELVLGPAASGPVALLSGLRIKWLAEHVNKHVSIFVSIDRTGSHNLRVTLDGVKATTTERLHVDKIFLEAGIQLKRLRVTYKDIPDRDLDIIAALI